MTLDTFIARQPIFDSHLVVQGYELLHRSGFTGAFDGRDPDQATVELLNGSLLVSRLADLTDGRPGFINMPRNLLVQDFIELLPPQLTVIEVLESVTPEPAVIAALRRLRAAGYTIALDDFVDNPGYDKLVSLADIVKVDFTVSGLEERKEVIERYKREGLRFLAEKIETREEFDSALEEGFDLFQGFFFCKPETTRRRDLPRCKITYVELLKEVNRKDLRLEEIEELIKSELSLSAKLLRYLNSVQFGLRDEIRSIHQALVYLGDRALRRWGTLIALSGLGDDKPLELVRTCLVRARFCETLAEETGIDAPSLDLYLTGMFSALDALIDQPIEVALEEIGLKKHIASAILGDDSVMSHAFQLALAMERGDLGGHGMISKHFALPPERVVELYSEAMFWADSLFSDTRAA